MARRDAVGEARPHANSSESDDYDDTTCPEFLRQQRQQAGLGRSHGAGAGVALQFLSVRAEVVRAIPQLGDAVDDVVVEVDRGRVHGTVRQVDAQAHHGDVLLGRGDRRGEEAGGGDT